MGIFSNNRTNIKKALNLAFKQHNHLTFLAHKKDLINKEKDRRIVANKAGLKKQKLWFSRNEKEIGGRLKQIFNSNFAHLNSTPMANCAISLGAIKKRIENNSITTLGRYDSQQVNQAMESIKDMYKLNTGIKDAIEDSVKNFGIEKFNKQGFMHIKRNIERHPALNQFLDNDLISINDKMMIINDLRKTPTKYGVFSTHLPDVFASFIISQCKSSQEVHQVVGDIKFHGSDLQEMIRIGTLLSDEEVPLNQETIDRYVEKVEEATFKNANNPELAIINFCDIVLKRIQQ